MNLFNNPRNSNLGGAKKLRYVRSFTQDVLRFAYVLQAISFIQCFIFLAPGSAFLAIFPLLLPPSSPFLEAIPRESVAPCTLILTPLRLSLEIREKLLSISLFVSHHFSYSFSLLCHNVFRTLRRKSSVNSFFIFTGE